MLKCKVVVGVGLFLCAVVILVVHVRSVPNSMEFPPEFLIGCASASYQVEGAWNIDGKGENIWDHFTHTKPERIKDKSTGDIACDSYHKYEEDVQLIKEIGFTHYRFSISWSRVLPTGHENHINEAGIRYYHRLIDELVANKIEPMVTLFHWDLPQPLQELGGWANPLMADYFEKYARIMFKEYGDKVRWWITINEPQQISHQGYGMKHMAPGLAQSGVADYLAAHTVLLAHGRAYRLYKRDFAPTQKGKIGISIHGTFFQPKTDSPEDKKAADRAMQFEHGIFAHPIFSKEGGYPQVVKEEVARLSREEGRTSSRLLSFTPEEIGMLRGSSDFYGLNHYTTKLAAAGQTTEDVVQLFPDAGVVMSVDPSWTQSASGWWLQSVPWGVRSLLNWIKREYSNIPVFVTENGWSTAADDPNVMEDNGRIQYYHDYLEQILKAKNEDGCDVLGYTAWTIIDNFEWSAGYSERFGIHHVDFEDPRRPRTKKKSAEFFKKVLETRKLPDIKEETAVPSEQISV